MFCFFLIGEAPEVGNYFVCVGMNGNSLQVGLENNEWSGVFKKTRQIKFLPFWKTFCILETFDWLTQLSRQSEATKIEFKMPNGFGK